MKTKQSQQSFEEDLFSSIQEAGQTKETVSEHDMLLESRKNTSFDAEKLEHQEDVQLIEKEDIEGKKTIESASSEAPKPTRNIPLTR